MVATNAAAPPPQRRQFKSGDVVRFPKNRCEHWKGKQVAVTLRNGVVVRGLLVDTRESGTWLDLDDATIISRDATRLIGEITIAAAYVGHAHLAVEGG